MSARVDVMESRGIRIVAGGGWPDADPERKSRQPEPTAPSPWRHALPFFAWIVRALFNRFRKITRRVDHRLYSQSPKD